MMATPVSPTREPAGPAPANDDAAAGQRGLGVVAALSGLGALALGVLAWVAHADAIFIQLVNAAIAMCM